MSSAGFSPNGLRIVTGSGDDTVRIWVPATGKELVALRGHEGVVSSAGFSPDGLRIVAGSRDKEIGRRQCSLAPQRGIVAE